MLMAVGVLITHFSLAVPLDLTRVNFVYNILDKKTVQHKNIFSIRITSLNISAVHTKTYNIDIDFRKLRNTSKLWF